MTYNFSKSRYCSGIQCPKILWLRENMPDEYDKSIINERILSTGLDVGDLAMGLFGEYTEIPYSSDLLCMIQQTKKLMEEGVINIAEASFSYDNCFCSVDILRNLGNNKIEIYEVKSSTTVKDINIHDVAYQNYVLTKLGYQVEKACLIHLNNQYVRKGDLDLENLFTIVDLSKEVKEKFLEVEEKIKSLRDFLKQKSEPKIEIGKHCSTPYECGFWYHCGKDFFKDDKKTIFNISRFSNVQECCDKGIITFEQVYESGILKGKQLQQVEVEVKNLPPQIQNKPIKEFLKTLTYPLYFLDFETIQLAIPLYDNSYPYQQIVFQYSLHILEKENGELKHRECLSYPGSDPRRQIAEQLCKDIPKNVCIIAYNMKFEKSRIKEMAKVFPDLHDHLMNIHDNIKDLMIPFQQRWYYSKEMEGSYSIKYVLPALFPNDPNLDYSNLEGVHNGCEASDVFFAMQKMEKTELDKWRNHLLDYCKLDTFAMVKILEKLKEVE